MTFRAKVTIGVDARTTGAPDVGSAISTIAEAFEFAFTDGVGDNQAKQIVSDDFTISGGVAQTYDLAGSLLNGLGQAVVFTVIKGIILINTGSTTLTYGGGSNPFLGFLADASDIINIPAGGALVLIDPTAAGQTVTASTGDIVTIDTAAAGSGTIMFIGETA